MRKKAEETPAKAKRLFEDQALQLRPINSAKKRTQLVGIELLLFSL